MIKGKILIIDDSEDDYILTERLLKKIKNAQYQISWSSNFENGLSEIKKNQYDACLVDYRLGDRTGVELIKEVRKTVLHLPMILLTGQSDEAVDYEAGEAGASDFINKNDINLQVLDRSLRYAIQQSRMMIDLDTKREEAEKATSLKDQFVSLVAHDLRSPIANSIGFINLLQEDLEEKINEDHLDMLNRIEKNSHNLLKLIEDLLNLNKIQAGSIKLMNSFFDPVLIVDSVFEKLSMLAENKGIDLKNEIPPDTLFYGDRSLITEVIMNLVSNAIKFCSEGDSITAFIPDSDTPTIAIKDTGPGIDPSLLPNIFREEIRTTTAGTSGEVGTGLGLPFSKKIMNIHSGDLTVESVLNKETVFYATLPERTPHILIVDDSKIRISVFQKFLSEIRAEVITAGNGKEALKILNSQPIDIIISDINMPEMDGFELLKIIKKESTLEEIPVIIVTADEKLETRTTAFNLGANDFIEGNDSKENFLSRIIRLMKHQ